MFVKVYALELEGFETRVSMGVVDLLNFENKIRIEGGVRDVRIQHQFNIFINLNHTSFPLAF